jgi:hypothetical protein
LNVTGRDGALVAHAIAMIDGSGQHVRNGLDAAMRMPGEARQIIVGNIIAEIVEKKKRIEVCCIAETESTPQMYSRALKRGLGLDQPFHWSDGQFGLLYQRVACSGGRSQKPEFRIQNTRGRSQKSERGSHLPSGF